MKIQTYLAVIIKYCTFSSICWLFFCSTSSKGWKLLDFFFGKKKKKKESERKWSIKLIKNTTAAAPGNLTVQHWRKQRLLAALGSALSKLLSRHKLLVSDQVLCLQLVYSSLVLLVVPGLFFAWSELEAAVSGGKVCSVTLHTGDRNKDKVQLVENRGKTVGGLESLSHDAGNLESSSEDCLHPLPRLQIIPKSCLLPPLTTFKLHNIVFS